MILQDLFCTMTNVGIINVSPSMFREDKLHLNEVGIKQVAQQLKCLLILFQLKKIRFPGMYLLQ